MNSQEQARQIIKSNNFMVLATSDENQPWISPVFFATADNKTFYWHSARNTKHSQIVAANSHVAVVIFNSTNPEIPGLYMKGQAMEVEEDKVEEGLEILFGKAVSNFAKREELLSHPEDFKGEGKLRLYKFIAEEFFLSNSEQWNNKWVDWTEKVDL